MPVIVVCSPKGGVGKSTVSLLLGTLFAAGGASAHIIDCDPNLSIATWAGLSRNPVTVSTSKGAEAIVEEIDAAATRHRFVIIDSEGSANAIVTNALGVADFVIIPMGESALDSRQGARAVRLTKSAERIARRSIPARVVMTRTSAAIQSRDFRNITDELRTAGVPIFTTSLVNRAAYRAMFVHRLALEELDPREVNGLQAALENARAFAQECVDWIRDARATGATNAA